MKSEHEGALAALLDGALKNFMIIQRRAGGAYPSPTTTPEDDSLNLEGDPWPIRNI